MSDTDTHHSNYVKIWAILVALLVVSVVGPMFEIQLLTLISAFGIAFVKAYFVVKYFMHIGHAARFVGYLVVMCLAFMLLFFAGTAPDVMKPDGQNWVKPSWQEAAPGAVQPKSEGHH